jgi:hypothetical protein
MIVDEMIVDESGGLESLMIWKENENENDINVISPPDVSLQSFQPFHSNVGLCCASKIKVVNFILISVLFF